MTNPWRKKKSILDKMILQWNIAVKLEHAVFILNKNTIEKKKKKTLYHLTSETLSSRHHNWFRIRTRDLFKATFGKTVVLLAWYCTKNKKIIRERQWKTLIVLKSSTLEIRLKVNDGWKSRFYRAFQNSEVLSTRKATWCWFIRKEALILNCSKFHLIFPYDFRVRLPK